MTWKCFVRALALAALTAARARVGHAQTQPLAVDGRLLRPGVDTLVSYVVRGNDTIPSGVNVDEMTIVGGADGAVLRRVYVTHDRFMGTNVDTMWNGQATLAPVRVRMRDEHELIALAYQPGRVTGRLVVRDRDTTAVDVSLPPAVFDGNSFDLVLRAAPLAPGWSADVPTFLPNHRFVAQLHASVLGVETIDGRPCWRVAGDFYGMPVTFWVDRETRELRQQVLQIGPTTQLLVRHPQRGAPLPNPAA